MLGTMANLGAGIVLIVFGLFLAVVGAALWSTCSSSVPVTGSTSGCSGFALPLFLGIVLVVLGIVVLALQLGRRTTRIQQAPDPSVPPPLIRPVVIQQTVEKEVVKVRCQYCGNLFDVTAKTCPSCGAPVI